MEFLYFQHSSYLDLCQVPHQYHNPVVQQFEKTPKKATDLHCKNITVKKSRGGTSLCSAYARSRCSCRSEKCEVCDEDSINQYM